MNCNFNEEGSFCRWKDDPRDKTAVWESMNYGPVIGDAACMKPRSSSNVAKHSARLWSSWLNIDVNKQTGLCLKFLYRFEMPISDDDMNGNKNVAMLSLLKHSEGLVEMTFNKNIKLPLLEPI